MIEPVALLVGILVLGAEPSATKTCDAPKQRDVVLLVVTSPDVALSQHREAIETTLRQVADQRLRLLPVIATKKALTVEGGQEKRQNTVVEARVLLQRADERFRELDPEVALSLIAKATAKLAAVHQEPGALALLAEAHLLAGEIFLARGRVDGARQRLQRALDLKPDLSPPRHRFSPRVLAEMEGVRGAESVRPTGRLEIRLQDPSVTANVYLDGRLRGQTPLSLDAVGTGRHLLRAKAPGFRSYIASVQIGPADDRREVANLSPDREVVEIERLAGRLRAGKDVGDVLKLLTTRSGADRPLLASMVLAERLTTAGTATVGVELSMPGAGKAYSPSGEARDLSAALDQVLACREGTRAPVTAPSILGQGAFRTTEPTPVPEPEPWWQKSWFWAAAAVAAVSVSGALVFARTSGGPPEAVSITLVPRPVE